MFKNIQKQYVAAICLGFALPAVTLGVSVMYALIILTIIAGLGSLRTANWKNLLTSTIIKISAVLLMVLVVSSFQGINPDYSIHKTIEFAAVGVVTVLLFIILSNMDSQHIRVMNNSMMIGIFIAMTLAYIDSFSNNYTLSTILHGQDKALTPHRLNFHSSAFAVLVPFVWAFYFNYAEQLPTYFRRTSSIFIPLSFMVIIICGGRAGWVGVFIAASVFILGMHLWYEFRIKLSHIIMLIITTILGISGYALSRGLPALYERLGIIIEGRGIASGRLDVWHNAIQHLTDNILLGIGPNAFRYLPEHIDAHPHSALLQVMLETGVVGTLLFLLLAFYIIKIFYKEAQHNIYGLATLSSVLAFASAAQFNMSIFDPEWIGLLAMTGLVGWFFSKNTRT